MDQVLWHLLPSTGNCIILTTISIPVQTSLFPGDYSNRPSPGSLLTTLQSYLGRQSPPWGTHPQLTTPPASCRTAPQGRARPTFHPPLGPLPASVHTHTELRDGSLLFLSQTPASSRPKAPTCPVTSAWNTIPGFGQVSSFQVMVQISTYYQFDF